MGLRRFGGPGMHGIGGVPLSSLGGGALGTYAGKVMGYGPLAYWPLNEASGTTARCLVNSLQNGTYSSDVSTWPVGTGIGDGNTAPQFDGTNDYVNVQTATLEAAINAAGAELSLMLWAKVAAGGWTDGAWRGANYFYDNFNNRFAQKKSNINNRLYYFWVGGATVEDHIDNGVSSTGWMQWVLTRSEAADEVKYYRDTGLLATDTTIGVWGSVGAWTNILIGCTSIGPVTEAWHGGLAHVVLFPFALSQPQINNLYIV